MKTRLCVRMIFLGFVTLYLILASGARAEEPVWTLLGPGSGPREFRFLTVDPQDGRVVYAGGPEGICRSQDRGDTWQRLGGGLGAQTVVIGPQDSQLIFAGDKQGLHKSEDGGQSWRQVYSGVSMEAVAIDPQNGQVVFAGGGQGIYRSTDQGDTWQQVKDGARLNVLVFDPGDAQVVYAGCVEGLYRSADHGLTWEKLHEGNFTQLLIDPRDTQVMHTIAQIDPLTSAYRSTDGGKTWKMGGDAPWHTSFGTLIMDPRNPNVLYVATEGGLFRSGDSGIYWERMGSDPRIWILARDRQDPSIIYGGAEDLGSGSTLIWTHFFRSEDGASTWRELPTHVPVFAAALDPQDAQTLYISTDRGVYRSRDTGQRWDLVNGDYTFAALLADPQVSHRLYGGGQGIYQSEDGGSTWTQTADLGGRSVSVLIADPRPPMRFYAIAGDLLYQSGDRGTTWVQVDGGLGKVAVHTLAPAPQNSQMLYAGTSGGVYQSGDRGVSWTRLTVPIDIGALAVGAQPPYPIYASISGDHRLYISEDEGRSWSLSSSLPGWHSETGVGLSPAILQVVTDPRDGRVLFATTAGGLVQRSGDGGTTWEPFNTGLPFFRGGQTYGGYYAYGSFHALIPRLLLSHSSPYIFYAATDWGLCRIGLPTPSAPPGEAEEDSVETTEEAWTSTGPTALLYGGFNLGTAVSTLAVDPQDSGVLYAGTPSGQVFKRAPDGVWSKAHRGLPGTAIHALAADPQNGQRVYAGVEGLPAIYSTEDGGHTWRPASGNSLFGSVYAVAFDPANPQTIYGAMNTVLVRTRNGGVSWEKLLTAHTQFSSLAIDPRDPQTIYAGARDPYAVYGEGGPWESGVYKSTDSGAHWQRIMEGRVAELALDPHAPSIVYALAEGKVYQSEDGGQTWSELDTRLLGGSIAALAVDPQQGGVLYLVAGNRIFKSADGGENWADLQAGLPNTPVYALAMGIGEPRPLFAATGHGVFSGEGLQNPALDQVDFPPAEAEVGADSVWTPEGIGEAVHELVIAPSDPRVIYAVAGGPTQGTLYESGDLYKKGVDGRWARVQSGGIFGFLAVDPGNAEILYASGSSDVGVNKSEDGAKIWNRVTYRDWRFKGDTAVIDPRNPQVIYIAGSSFVLKSEDGGKAWTARDNPFRFASLAIDLRMPQTLYAASYGPGLFKSVDGGSNWQKIAYGAAHKVALDWQDPQLVYALIDNLLYFSGNAGSTWRLLPLGSETEPLTALALDWQRSSTLYAAAWGKVYRSADWGTTWAAMGSGLPDTTISVLAVDPLHPQLVYAGTGKGLYSIISGSLSPADTAGAEVGEDRGLPTTTALGQNFPNPFNLQTSIPYRLKASSVVLLEIFDLQGHRVRTLKQGLQPPGRYRLVWDGRDGQGQELASGIYLVRLQVGNFAAVRKALLIK